MLLSTQVSCPGVEGPLKRCGHRGDGKNDSLYSSPCTEKRSRIVMSITNQWLQTKPISLNGKHTRIVGNLQYIQCESLNTKY